MAIINRISIGLVGLVKEIVQTIRRSGMDKRKLIQVTDTVRVENGPRRKRAVATAELLDDRVTHPSYHAERRDDEGYVIQEAGRDSMGKPIVEGEEMDYLDHLGEWGWYVYQYREVGIDAQGRLTDAPDDIDHMEWRYVPVSVEATKDAALNAARGL